jgi:hypothetical protein
MDNIRVFKIMTGEEIISRVTEETDTTFTLNKPRVVAIAPGPNGQVSVTLIPLFASNQDGDAGLEKAAIVAEVSEINDELEKGYIQQTTGIALA